MNLKHWSKRFEVIKHVLNSVTAGYEWRGHVFMNDVFSVVK